MAQPPSGASPDHPTMSKDDKIIMANLKWFKEGGDEGFNPERNKKIIADTIKKTKGVKSYHKMRSRKLGSSVYLDLHLQVDGKLTVQKGHDITEIVKNTLIKNNPKIIDVLVHLEPK